MEQGSIRVKENIPATAEPVKIPAVLTTAVRYTYEVSPMAVAASSGLVDALMSVADSVGGFIGRNLPAGSSTSNSGPTAIAAKNLGINTAKSAITIWDTLEGSAAKLIKTARDNSIDISKAKYGDEAGQFTQELIDASTNMGSAAYTAYNIGTKQITKRYIMKRVGKSIVKTYLSDDGKVVNETVEELPNENTVPKTTFKEDHNDSNSKFKPASYL